MAVSLLRRGRIKKIVLVRPAVEAGEHLGFLPGDLEAKINPYLAAAARRASRPDGLRPDPALHGQRSDRDRTAGLHAGPTLNDAAIILDEGQNATVPQMKMFLTRMGQNARIVVTGDITQVDLPLGNQERAGRRDRAAQGHSRDRDGVPRSLGHRPAPSGAGDRRCYEATEPARSATGGMSPPRPRRPRSTSYPRTAPE